ncbi:unnamed protein product [Periconia digitata]|uniref:Uncharacterized protein n=1 Tax=Periconia digitata TaxID=1303443 RepID=A0A9W4UQ87_9PLEO|nr:unnamed protein product [Periconia digitata]
MHTHYFPEPCQDEHSLRMFLRMYRARKTSFLNPRQYRMLASAEPLWLVCWVFSAVSKESFSLGVVPLPAFQEFRNCRISRSNSPPSRISHNGKSSLIAIADAVYREHPPY